MIKQVAFVYLFLSFSLWTTQSFACAAHMMYLDPDKFGFVGGAVVRMAGLAAPEPVFKLEHPPTARVPLGEESELVISYERPWFSKGVKIQLTGTGNVTMIDKELELSDFDGSVSARFLLTGDGFNAITLTVSGEHKGETVRETSKIYVRARKALNPEDVQVTSR